MEVEEEEEEAAGSLTCSERGPAHMTSPAAAIVLPPPRGDICRPTSNWEGRRNERVEPVEEEEKKNFIVRQ